MTINGGTLGNILIDGATQFRVFFVDTGTVTLANLQIQNAAAQRDRGGNGDGGGGGDGGGTAAGPAVFVNLGSLNVVNSVALGSSASAGAGGAGSSTPANGSTGTASPKSVFNFAGSINSAATAGPSTMLDPATSVPALSEWGMGATTLLLLGSAIWLVKRPA